jgi:hypothetical protein
MNTNYTKVMAVYELSSWDGFLITKLNVRCQRISSDVFENIPSLNRRIDGPTTHFLFHIGLTVTERFPLQRQKLIKLLDFRRIVLLNRFIVDVRKRFVQSFCRRIGLRCSLAESTGPKSELVIVKTNDNCGGEAEQRLSARDRQILGLPGVHPIIRDTNYQVLRRGDVPTSWWQDNRLCIENYIHNKEDLFFRVYILLDKLVVSSLISDQLVKRPDTRLPRRNFLFSRRETLEGPRTRLPVELLHSVSVFQKAFRLDYGAIDLVMDDSRRFYIVDVNPTPFWGTENQPEITAHLSEALAS